MKRKIRIFALLLLFCFLLPESLTSQSISSDIDSLLRQYGETYLKVRLNSSSDISKLSSFTSVARVSGDTAFVNVNRAELEMLVQYGFSFIHTPIVRPPDEELMRTKENEATGTWDYYPTWQEFDSIMFAFEQNYPALCKTYNILTLNSGRKILLVKLTSGSNPAGGKPLFLYSSTMHGNETAGYILMLRLTDHLLSGYGTDPEATWLLDNMEIWICPLANPDGTYYGGNHTVSGAIRRNANNVDLNRNYPDPRVGANPDGNPYQPETIAFMGIADTLPFTMGANLHTGAEVVNYPWDTWYKLHPDNQWWVQVSRKYADTVQANSPPGFFTDLNNGVTNGAAWYVITGGRQDYMNYFAHCRELTLEVSEVFILPASQLNNMWGYHNRALINYMKEGWYGMRGQVTDSVTGLPLRAKVWVNAHDADSSQVWSDAYNGAYFRPVYQGSYSVTWSATGYYPKTIQIQVPYLDTVIVDVQLVPVGFSIRDNAPGQVAIWYDKSGDGNLRFSRQLQTGSVMRIFSTEGKLLFVIPDPGANERIQLKTGVYIISINTPDNLKATKKLLVF